MRYLKPVILNSWQVEIKRVVVQAQSGQRPHETHLNQWVGMLVHGCQPSYVEKHK
jgi:predicted RNase H-like nuclease